MTPVLARSLTVSREDVLTGERHVAVRDLDLCIETEQRVALVGANGAGKTSLLLACVGAVPFTGTLRVCELSVEPRTLDRVRAQVGFVFAEPSDQLFCDTVAEEVRYGPRARGVDEPTVEQRSLEALERVGLSDKAARSPHSLSFGEQRRLALAATLACAPALLLLDEPTANLDGRARQQVLTALERSGGTTLIATHDLDFALSLAARVIVLAGGEIVGDGPASVVLRDAALLDRAGLLPPLGGVGPPP